MADPEVEHRNQGNKGLDETESQGGSREQGIEDQELQRAQGKQVSLILDTKPGFSRRTG